MANTAFGGRLPRRNRLRAVGNDDHHAPTRHDDHRPARDQPDGEHAAPGVDGSGFHHRHNPLPRHDQHGYRGHIEHRADEHYLDDKHLDYGEHVVNDKYVDDDNRLDCNEHLYREYVDHRLRHYIDVVDHHRVLTSQRRP